jgi:hypothetical protein
MVLIWLKAELSPMTQMHIFNSLIVTNRWNVSSQRREKNMPPSSKSFSLLLDSCFTNLKHRISFEKLLETNKMLTTTLTESAKRPRANNSEFSADIPPGLGNPGSSSLPPTPLSRADYPKVKFWTKEEWDNHKSCLKDISRPKSKGPEHASKGMNTTVLYMENEDGMPISGVTVGQMWVVA